MKIHRPLLTLTAITSFSFAGEVDLKPIGTWETGIFDESAAEIVQHHPASQRLYVVNGDLPGIDVIDIANADSPEKLFSIEPGPWGDDVQSVAIHGDLVAVAVSADPVTDPGWIAFYDFEGEFLGKVAVGPLPDMVTFTNDGKFVLSANEGEPSDDYSIDPEGSISIIQVPADPSQGFPAATTLTFSAFNGKEIKGSNPGHPDSTLAQNLEPEYIAVSPDDLHAIVTLQESNAVAIIDLEEMKITDVVGLGFQDRSQVPFDASDKDKQINIRNWPTLGMFQPDSITAFEIEGVPYFATANEGDARDYDGWSEEARLEDLSLDPTAFPDAETLQEKENLGRLKVTTAIGDTDGDGDFDEIYHYGGRSFSILNAAGETVYDSGSVIEEKLAELLPDDFNSNNDENDSFDKRSDDKGAEPEAIAFGEINGRPLLFVGLERVGGIMIFDVSDPTAPEWLNYVTTRDFSGDAEKNTAGDLGPEGIIVIQAENSPTGKPLLVVSNEVSGSVTIFEILSL